MVYAVTEHFRRFFGIFIITAEHAERMTFVQAQNNFAYFIRFAGRTVGTDNVYVVAGRGLSHGTGLYVHSGESTRYQGQFGLAVTLAQRYARFFFKRIEDIERKRFACGRAFFQRRQIVIFNRFSNKIAVHGRRSAKRCNAVLREFFKQFARNKHVHIINKDRAAAQPLAVYFSPHRLCPAGFGNA